MSQPAENEPLSLTPEEVGDIRHLSNVIYDFIRDLEHEVGYDMLYIRPGIVASLDYSLQTIKDPRERGEVLIAIFESMSEKNADAMLAVQMAAIAENEKSA